MLPGEELHVLAGQGLVAVVGDGHAFVVAQWEAGVEHLLAGLEHQGVLGVVLTVDAEGVEQGLHVDRQGELVVLLEDGLDQRTAFTAAVGVQLQQAVAAGMHLAFQALALGFGFAQQRTPGVFVGVFQQRQQARAELVLQGVAGGAGGEEGVQRAVVPLEQALLGLFSR